MIWSTYGSVETVDHIRGLKYTQEFKNNLDEICLNKKELDKIVDESKLIIKKTKKFKNKIR